MSVPKLTTTSIGDGLIAEVVKAVNSAIDSVWREAKNIPSTNTQVEIITNPSCRKRKKKNEEDDDVFQSICIACEDTHWWCKKCKQKLKIRGLVERGVEKNHINDIMALIEGTCKDARIPCLLCNRDGKIGNPNVKLVCDAEFWMNNFVCL